MSNRHKVQIEASRYGNRGSIKIDDKELSGVHSIQVSIEVNQPTRVDIHMVAESELVLEDAEVHYHTHNKVNLDPDDA